MLVTHYNVSPTPPCLSHSTMLVTLHYVSHTPQCSSHFTMFVTLFLHVSHIPYQNLALGREILVKVNVFQEKDQVLTLLVVAVSLVSMM